MQPHNSNVTTELRTAQENNTIASRKLQEKQKAEYDYLINQINNAANNGLNATFVCYNLEYIDINTNGQSTPQLHIPQRVLQYIKELENKGYKVTPTTQVTLTTCCFKVKHSPQQKTIRLDIKW